MASPPLLRSLHLRFEYWLFDLPVDVGGRALQLALVPLRYLYALGRDFIRGDLGLRAMGLVYSSLFAIVPVRGCVQDMQIPGPTVDGLEQAGV